MCAVPKLGFILGDGRAGVVPGLQVLNPAWFHRLDRLAAIATHFRLWPSCDLAEAPNEGRFRPWTSDLTSAPE
jgi:hypothetical protein